MSRPTGVITAKLLGELHRHFVLDWHGIHGITHWGRVRANALRLAEAEGAHPRVVELFSVLHDSCRHNDGHDPDHGLRGADYAAELNGQFFDLDAQELDLLRAACVGHSAGLTEAHRILQVCWDADRLDLGRVGVVPDPELLCTKLARDPLILWWAFRRSTRG